MRRQFGQFGFAWVRAILRTFEVSRAWRSRRIGSTCRGWSAGRSSRGAGRGCSLMGTQLEPDAETALLLNWVRQSGLAPFTAMTPDEARASFQQRVQNTNVALTELQYVR